MIKNKIDIQSYEQLYPDFNDWPLLKHTVNRSNFAYNLTNKVVENIISENGASLAELIEKTVYQEKRRIKNDPWKVDPKDDKEYWDKIANAIQNKSISENRKLYEFHLKKIVGRYTEEVLGHFVPKTHRFMRNFLYRLFNVIYNKSFFFASVKSKKLMSKLHLTGYVKEVRNMYDNNTIVFVPTHYSNLDSILLGYIIDMVAGLPANSSGAGLNLYNYEIPAYFMSKLGAYKVDRRKKNLIYQKTLLTMSSLSLKEGVNSMFFPGGSRSRSGAIEKNLKLGLLRSIIGAQSELLAEQSNRKIIIVPVTFGYHFVLEAKPLIEQYLKAEGKSKYLKSKSKGKMKLFKFFKNLMTKESEVFLSFGKPIDVLGHEFDDKGRSIDNNGEIVNLKGYFEIDGKIEKNLQREKVYTRKLAKKITESYHENNIVLSSHLVAYVGFKNLKESHPDKEVYSIVSTPSKDFSITYNEFKNQLEQVKDQLLILNNEGKLKLEPVLLKSTDEIITKGIKHINSYHGQRPIYLSKNKNQILSEDLKLLYYYSNKLNGYPLS